MAETFAHLLHRFRTRCGLTKGDLAEAVGAHRHSLLDWEAGRRVPRDRARLEDLAQVLGLSPSEAKQLIAAARQHPSAQPGPTPSTAASNGAGAAPPAQPGAGSSRHQLRTPLPDFVGHTETIRMLTDTLRQASSDGRVAAISGVRGMGGIGKTELAYLVANQLVESFPDAQIVVLLRGTSATPLTPIQAMQQVIYAFTLETRLPDEPEAVQRHYRSVLHQKRVLILADDARDATQVRWLLPPIGCALLVTSRTRFSLPGMTTLDLEVLDEAVAVTLLYSLCNRLSTTDAQYLARACGYLPLALHISGSLLHNDPALDVATYIARLTDKQQRLAQLRDPDDPQLDVAATLALSYIQLEEHSQRVFRQLGVMVTDFSTEFAHAVVAAPEGQDVSATLHGLLRRNLVMYERTHDRWWLHDLVRDLAWQELEQQGEAEAVQWRYAQAAVRIGQTIQDQYQAGGDAMLLALAQFDAEQPHIDEARRWAMAHAGTLEGDMLLLEDARATIYIGELRYDMRRERIPQLERAHSAAHRLGDRPNEVLILNSIGNSYSAMAEYQQAMLYYEQVLSLARAIDDCSAEGRTLNNLGFAYMEVREIERATICYEQALSLARATGDHRTEGQALCNLGLTYWTQGEIQRAITYYEQALSLTQAMGDQHREGRTLNNLGLAYWTLGQIQPAIMYHKQALNLVQAIGDRRTQGQILDSLGLAYESLGEAHHALGYFEQALKIACEYGNRQGEGYTTCNLGCVYIALGDIQRAHEACLCALDIAREVGDHRLEGYALSVLGRVLAIFKEPECAATTFQQALNALNAVGDRDGTAECGWHFGLFLLRQGEREPALPLLRATVAYRQTIGHTKAAEHAALLAHLEAGEALEQLLDQL